MFLDPLPNLKSCRVTVLKEQSNRTSKPGLQKALESTKPNLIKAFSVYFQLFRQNAILSAGFADCARGTNYYSSPNQHHKIIRHDHSWIFDRDVFGNSHISDSDRWRAPRVRSKAQIKLTCETDAHTILFQNDNRSVKMNQNNTNFFIFKINYVHLGDVSCLSWLALVGQQGTRLCQSLPRSQTMLAIQDCWIQRKRWWASWNSGSWTLTCEVVYQQVGEKNRLKIL